MSDQLILLTDDGAQLNANVEMHERGLVLHSRSGTVRNRDYRAALEMLLSRLDHAQIAYRIYLDSKPVQGIDITQRELFFDRMSPVAARFNELVRAMNKGSSSRGAWRRLLIETPGTGAARLREVAEGKSNIVRLSARELRKVKSSNIHKAVQKLLDGGDAPNFAPSREYDALTDTGIPLAPKKVFGLALEDALGIEVHPGHFSAGWGKICFELLEEAGLWIVPKKEGIARPKPDPKIIETELGVFVPTEEERSWIEGNPKIVSHLKRERAPGLAKEKRAAFMAEHKRLFCEDCKFDPIEKYGPEAGSACIEVHHHRTHVAKMQPGHETSMEDLKCLCANCHRVLHRKLALGLAVSL
ncbi:HNH endonuclease [Rhizobium johnstonii]|uniref:HNH endonuclease n=1 Tax=Rhizobium johnstonii TaxID=3019933 RepID=UPI003F9CBD3D